MDTGQAVVEDTGKGGEVEEVQPQGQQPSQPEIIEVSADDDAVLGDENAPITIIEFSDYECPFCARFYLNTLPRLKSEYIDTGKVKLIYRDFPLSSIHPNAQKAAEAAECAEEQGKYYEMHDKIFENQQAITTTDLKKYANEIGLDTNTFNVCLDSGEMAGEVQKDFQDGQLAGVRGTPTFFINGKPLVGAQPFEAFQQIIEGEL
jgi:protein-disulfide isomerase